MFSRHRENFVLKSELFINLFHRSKGSLNSPVWLIIETKMLFVFSKEQCTSCHAKMSITIKFTNNTSQTSAILGCGN